MLELRVEHVVDQMGNFSVGIPDVVGAKNAKYKREKRTEDQTRPLLLPTLQPGVLMTPGCLQVKYYKGTTAAPTELWTWPYEENSIATFPSGIAFAPNRESRVTDTSYVQRTSRGANHAGKVANTTNIHVIQLPLIIRLQ